MSILNKTILPILLLALLTTRCKEEKPSFDEKLLEGDWIMVEKKTPGSDYGAVPPPPPPIAWGTFLSLNNNAGGIPAKSYKVSGDTLSIFAPPRSSKHQWIKDKSWVPSYRIKRVKEDTLVLTYLNDSTEIFFLNARRNYNTSVDLEKLTYISEGCLGNCPAMKLEITKDSIFYSAHHYTAYPIGDFEGKITKELFNYIQDKIRSLNLDTLPGSFDPPVRDSWYYGLSIRYNGKEAKGRGQVRKYPALKSLIIDLTELPSILKLSPASRKHVFEPLTYIPKARME